MSAVIVKEELHPAAEWALQTDFSPQDVDCTTAVVLKILDNKCKMLPGEKLAVLAVYDAVKHGPARLFDDAVHDTIHRARHVPGARTKAAIHRLRVDAEARIAKPVMKRYKAMLRDGLFG